MQTEKKIIAGHPNQDEQWEGYTLDDLRYRRAYVAARRELEKERLFHNVGSMRNGVSKSANTVMRRVTSSIPFLEYGVMAFSVGQKVFRLFGKLRKKK